MQLGVVHRKYTDDDAIFRFELDACFECGGVGDDLKVSSIVMIFSGSPYKLRGCISEAFERWDYLDG